MREITDRDGVVWVAELVSHGRTSGYLNPKVHRPLVQFTCRSKQAPRKYASVPVRAESFESLSDEQLLQLLGESQAH
jgi:hypothetical protein